MGSKLSTYDWITQDGWMIKPSVSNLPHSVSESTLGQALTLYFITKPICLSPPKEINIQYSILLGSTPVQLIPNKQCFIFRSNFSVSLIVRCLCCVVHSQKFTFLSVVSHRVHLGGQGDNLFKYQWAFCIFLIYSIFLLNSREGCVDCDHSPRWSCYGDGGMQMQQAVAPSIIATFCGLFSPLYPFQLMHLL